jgi:hypothetical protein
MKFSIGSMVLYRIYTRQVRYPKINEVFLATSCWPRTLYLVFLICRNTARWPRNLIMQLIPQQLLAQLQHLFKQSKNVGFRFSQTDLEALGNLQKIMSSGFVSTMFLDFDHLFNPRCQENEFTFGRNNL